MLVGNSSSSQNSARWQVSIVTQPLTRDMVRSYLDDAYTLASEIADLVKISFQASSNNNEQKGINIGQGTTEGTNAGHTSTQGSSQGASYTRTDGKNESKNSSSNSSGTNSSKALGINRGLIQAMQILKEPVLLQIRMNHIRSTTPQATM
ncbi:hypothetical protein PCI56_08250 [Plesiomonas shigelloides subsp. oncorhynchi]|nr:hypothetical protein [Plesiomonas shigelloides]